MERLSVDDVELEYEVRGEGEPVLLIHPSVVADGLAWPLFGRPEIAARYRLIHYHRRGYVGSSLGPEPLTIARQARDAAALLRHLGAGPAHVAGHSIGGLIALQLAADAPELVGSLALLEPSIPMAPGAQDSFGRLFPPVIAAYRSGDKGQALELFSDRIFGPGWQAIVEHAVPGGAARALKDLDTFMLELPGLQEWRFGPEEAARIAQPVLSVRGNRGEQFRIQFVQACRAQVHSWFPTTEDADVPATHLLQMEDPQGVAAALAGFFSRHALGSGGAAAARSPRTEQSRTRSGG